MAWADETGSRAYVSPQLLAMTGFSPGEWLAEPDMWVRRLHPEDRERVLRQFRDACASGRALRLASTACSTATGASCGGATRGACCPGPDGKARFVRGFVLDITEQRLAEESLRQAAALRPAHRAAEPRCCCRTGSAARSPSRRAPSARSRC